MKSKWIVLAALTAAASPAHAEVKQSSEAGFLVSHMAEVSALPDVVWKRLITPKDWWNAAHSWSGSTAGFSIDAKAGGCFCELIQEKDAKGVLRTIGSVEHMRVIFTQPGKVLRMQGALGPLQSEAVLGTLTVAMEPLKEGAGTKLSFNYIVGGHSRFPMLKMAPLVDKVLGEQFAGLIKPLGTVGAESKTPESEWSLDLKSIDDKASEEKVSEGAEPADAEPDSKTGKPEKVEPDNPE
ncbi:hypothetical protein [Sphingorhabdus sp.]|jgi:hypothetical protein|uniref:hypothetical protein n=1 Tax=Sphingorhabdus sp. TaxID=1902408 RepID=UPI003BB1C59E|nr:hypothetical protein [Sphingomonadales bacterium]MBK9431116.1 hypothetical protein [Sphingomonadales bacterium]MBL0021254.1 hypothetical protein [Sphingomonadales bacterium]